MAGRLGKLIDKRACSLVYEEQDLKFNWILYRYLLADSPANLVSSWYQLVCASLKMKDPAGAVS